MNLVTSGLEHFVTHPPPEAREARIGLLTNPSGIDRRMRSAVDHLVRHDSITVTALFGPEHGVRGEAQAGDHVGGGRDLDSGLPIHSLYGASQTPTEEMLSEIDAMVFDIQDIGARFTTYISTLAKVMTACATYGKEVIVLDRPNPLGGAVVAGNVLEQAHESFVGIHEIPTRHGLTIGEFARLWARDNRLPDPIVVPMTGWSRAMWFDQTSLPWVLPSPNLPTLDSVAAFPATCFLEGTNLSEGRGTTRPFEMFGAPWIEPGVLSRELSSLAIPGVAFRPVFFTPMFSKHQGVRCGGVQLYIEARDTFDSVNFAPILLATVKRVYPGDFSWLAPTGDAYFIDKLAGSADLRITTDAGASTEALVSKWNSQSAEFISSRSDILLY